MGATRHHSPTPRRRQARPKVPAKLKILPAILLAGLLFSGLTQARADGLVGVRSALTQSPAIATSAKLENGNAQAKLTFDLTRPVTTSSFVLAGPDRIVIDLPQVDFQVDPQVGAEKSVHERAGGAPGLVASFRFGLFAPRRSRIVIDLAAPARIVRAESEPAGEGGKSRLVIALERTDRAAFQAAAQRAVIAADAAAQQAQRAAPAQSSASNDPGLPLIVIDPGHGGIDSGAIANGLMEKNVVFAFAKTLAGKLAASGRYKVVMTRNSDVFLSLGERVRIAENSGAALFISIHADTIYDAANVSGATVYTLSDHATDAEAAHTAEKENQADATAGVAGSEAGSGVSDILADLTREETRAYSHVFARTLVNYWKVAARLNRNPERAAGFRVLKAPDVPSVLIELGYLSNAKDAACLTSPAWREATAGRLAAAVDAFFAARGGNSGARTPLPPTAATTAEDR